jgi:hypothetical protein
VCCSAFVFPFPLPYNDGDSLSTSTKANKQKQTMIKFLNPVGILIGITLSLGQSGKFFFVFSEIQSSYS